MLAAAVAAVAVAPPCPHATSTMMTEPLTAQAAVAVAVAGASVELHPQMEAPLDATSHGSRVMGFLRFSLAVSWAASPSPPPSAHRRLPSQPSQAPGWASGRR